jgi:PAS domain S-box-containing protein
MTVRDDSRSPGEGGIAGIAGDITVDADRSDDERELIAALRERGTRLQLAVEAAQMGTFVWFPQGDRCEPDARMRALFGVPPEGTLNLSEAMSTMIHPDDREMYAQVVASAIDPSGDGRLFAEIRVIHPDQSLHWIAVTAHVVFESDSPQDSRMYGSAADITEQKRSTEALQRSETRYRALFESIDQGFCRVEVLFDVDGRAEDYRFLEINPAFARNTGLDNALGRRMSELVPGHEDHWYRTYGEVARSRKPVRFEAEAAALGRWYNVYAYPIGEPGEHQVAILFEDITERRRAEAALRENASRYRTLVQNLPDYAIFLLDPEGIIVEWSEGAERITGFSAEEAMGQHVALIYPEEAVLAGEPERELAEAARTGRVEWEGWVARKDGERFWSNEIATAIRNEAGTLLGYTKISRDLTEKRQATAALSASEERVRSILEEVRDYAIFTTDATGRIEDWFPGAVSVFGWSAAEAEGMMFSETFTPEDRANGVPEREFSEARQRGAAPDVRWHQHKNRSRVFIEGVTRPRYDLDGTFLGVIKIGRDVTERRLAELERAEGEVRRRLELEARVASATAELRMLSRRLLTVQEEERRFLARELHDEIGQILTGLALTLSAGASKDQLEEARHIVGELTDKVRQLSMDLRPATLDTYGLLPAIRSHLERYETRTGILIDLRTEGLDRRFAAPVEITAYRVVQEALTNLARYAKTSSGVVQLIADAETLFVSVRDDGFGFDPAQITKGTGIGGMRERVELLGGRFEIEAAPGQGAAITAELPLLPVAVKLGEASA